MIHGIVLSVSSDEERLLVTEILMMACRKFCKKFKGIRRSISGYGGGVKVYEKGIKRCTLCKYFKKTTEKMCTCCGTPFRYTAKGTRRIIV